MSEEGKFLADALISSIDPTESLDIIEQQYNNNIERFVKETIIYPIIRATPDVQEAYNKLFEIDLSDLSDKNIVLIDKYISILSSYLGLDATELKIRLGFDTDALKKSNALNFIPQKTFGSTVSELKELDDALSALDTAYSKFISKDDELDFSDISALNEKFKDVSGIDNYIRAIQNAKGNAAATQIAFDNLLTAYIKHTGITDNVTEENARLINSFFEEHGITAILANDIDLVAAEKYYAANASFDLANVTESELAAFIREAESASIARASMIELMMAKISCNNTDIVTDGDIANLIALANAAGIAEAAVKNAQYAQKQKNAPGVVRSAGAENAINTSIADNLESGMRTDLYKPKEYKLSGGRATNTARKSNASGGGDAQSRKETEAQKKNSTGSGRPLTPSPEAAIRFYALLKMRQTLIKTSYPLSNSSWRWMNR